MTDDACLETEQKNRRTIDRGSTFAHPAGPPGWLRISAWCVAIIAGFLEIWANRFFITPDGNNYLDVAGAYLRHDWASAVNAYWSPMFSWILGAVIYVTHVPAYWEKPALHLINFVAFLVSLLAFEFFFRGLLKTYSFDDVHVESPAWWLIGYSLFLSTSLYVLNIAVPTPDVWLAAMTYLAAGIVVRIHNGEITHAIFACLGAVLALGYLLKAFFFPLSFVILLAAWLATGNLRKTVPQILVATLVFSALSGPFIFALSRSTHRLTFGDTGRANYFMYTAPVLQGVFWQGENNTGLPKHPTRELLKHPRLYEFGTPFNASYPPYYAWSYWMEGAASRFYLRGQLVTLRQAAGTFYEIWEEQAIFSVGLLILAFALAGWRLYLSSVAKLWYVWLPSLLACLAYSIVHTEQRLVAPFLLILWTAGFVAIPTSRLSGGRRVLWAVALAMCFLTCVRVAKSAVSEGLALRSSPAARENVDWDVAEGLRAMGIRPDDKVAGIVIMGRAHWARLAGVKVVAEIPLGEELTFWTADSELRRSVIDTFAGTGARAIIAEAPPLCADKTEWKQLPQTDYYVYQLDQR